LSGGSGEGAAKEGEGKGSECDLHFVGYIS
jgi:hypothetical protein